MMHHGHIQKLINTLIYNFCVFLQQVLGDEATFLVEALFRIFDDDKSGSIDFEEFILALNATKFRYLKKVLKVTNDCNFRMNTAEEKLQWIFTVFDK